MKQIVLLSMAVGIKLSQSFNLNANWRGGGSGITGTIQTHTLTATM